jgi:hypothetical protein
MPNSFELIDSKESLVDMPPVESGNITIPSHVLSWIGTAGAGLAAWFAKLQAKKFSEIKTQADQVPQHEKRLGMVEALLPTLQTRLEAATDKREVREDIAAMRDDVSSRFDMLAALVRRNGNGGSHT